jgi:hypothetical protein
MSWTEKDMQTQEVSTATVERAKVLQDAVSGKHAQVLKGEVSNGTRPYKPISLQPVRAPGIYEGEFGVKEEDLIFHFWPWNYHQMDSEGRPTPRFHQQFIPTLNKVMGDVFGANRIEVSEDRDLGAVFAKARNWASNQFHRELCVKVCQELYTRMGGEG